MGMAKKRKAGRPKGSGDGLSEARQAIRAPALLLLAAEQAAQKEGITVTEWWRRAARVRLGWRETL